MKMLCSSQFMKKLILFCVFIGMTMLVYAHNIREQQAILREWILKDHTTLKATFFMVKADQVVLENTAHTLVSFPIASFSTADQAFIRTKMAQIQQLNKPIDAQSNLTEKSTGIELEKLLLAAFCLLLVLWLVVSSSGKFQVRSLAYLLVLFGLSAFYSFVLKPYAPRVLFGSTNPLTIDSAFVPFKPNVYTRWDNQYFYVESKGIPTTHPMMAGITSWQQQVPIPQCYIGNNPWSIPLNPEIASTPVPVNQKHFLRGAVAVAVNGIAIFNPYTNTGVDALLDGQLDNWGGHCGRADDYHYHTAPLHLYGHTAATLPIAYALDGFAVYGSVEPDGAPMKALDANHGHFGPNGVYHYHGTATAPYMIGNMVGKVTEDSTLQIIPQAAAKSIRPAGAPLKGATIISCVPNSSNNGYALNYTLNGQNYTVDYNWANGKQYIFNFINPGGTTTSTYNGYLDCKVPTRTSELFGDANAFELYPNPTRDECRVKLSDQITATSFENLAIFSATGQRMQFSKEVPEVLSTAQMASGVYFVVIKTKQNTFVKKLMIQ